MFGMESSGLLPKYEFVWEYSVSLRRLEIDRIAVHIDLLLVLTNV